MPGIRIGQGFLQVARCIAIRQVNRALGDEFHGDRRHVRPVVEKLMLEDLPQSQAEQVAVGKLPPEASKHPNGNVLQGVDVDVDAPITGTMEGPIEGYDFNDLLRPQFYPGDPPGVWPVRKAESLGADPGVLGDDTIEVGHPDADESSLYAEGLKSRRGNGRVGALHRHTSRLTSPLPWENSQVHASIQGS
jgi:hypothetical protein